MPPDPTNQEQKGPKDAANTPVTANPEHIRALKKVNTLVGSMYEARDMTAHVVERLEGALQLVAASPLQEASLVGIRVNDITQAFSDFLNRFSGKKTVFRLVCNREVVSQIQDFHKDIDKALSGLGLNVDETAWRQRWESCREAQREGFEKISGDRVNLMSDIRGDPQAQTQALAYLLYEFRCMVSKYTEQELAVLNKAFKEVSTFSQNKAPMVKTWFLPAYEFMCDDAPFAWGAFGTVHYGKYEGCDVIVKRVKITGERVRAEFIKEAEVWFRANDIPNVVRLFGAYHLGTDPYFVSERAANGNLADYLFSEEKNRRKTWKLLHDAANGLRALHHRRILHNDLKCNNILVTSDIVAKLTDFGLSAQLYELQATTARKPDGAFGWKAFEVLSGRTGPSYASDIYSFAMCIYEAVTCSLPWARDPEFLIRRKLEQGLLPPRPDGAFTDAQWQLIKDMTSLKPEYRISMDEVVNRLSTFEDDESNNNLRARNGMTLADISEEDEECASEFGEDRGENQQEVEDEAARPASDGQDNPHYSSAQVPTDEKRSSVPQEPEVLVEAELSASSERSNNNDPTEQLESHVDAADLGTETQDGPVALVSDPQVTVQQPQAADLHFDPVNPSASPFQAIDAAGQVVGAQRRDAVVVVVDASITEFAIRAAGKKFVEYKIELQTQDGVVIPIRRRYSDLRSLRKILSSRLRQRTTTSPPIPSIPSRKMLWSRNLEAVANARLESLSRFVQFVVQDAELPVEVDYGANETAHTIGVFEGGAGGAKVVM